MIHLEPRWGFLVRSIFRGLPIVEWIGGLVANFRTYRVWTLAHELTLTVYSKTGDFPTVEKGVPDFNPMGCQKGACWHGLLNAKERVTYPLKRAGERGDGKWEQISWDQALTEIAEVQVKAGNKSAARRTLSRALSAGWKIRKIYDLTPALARIAGVSRSASTPAGSKAAISEQIEDAMRFSSSASASCDESETVISPAAKPFVVGISPKK